jgi:UDP-N-acetylglucosamine--N-acetylmuramyl-(pentapeptide) pyrophosphoryl-undecaprenol N-acetylglucosamine transferase
MHDEKQKISLRVACGIPDDTMPIITVVGGGTGANFLNRLIYETIGDLTRMCHVVHITGKGKSGTPREPYIHGKYHAYEYLGEELLEYIALADCVITRAGMGMLSELSVFGTPTIIIPIPYSHQEKNAVYFEREKHAALYLSQQGLTKEKYISSIRRVLHDNVLRQELSYNMYHALPREGAQNIKKLIEEVIKP